VPHCVDPPDVDDLVHAVLGWEGGTGDAFHLHRQTFTSFRRQTRSMTPARVPAASAQTFQSTLGAMDHWVWDCASSIDSLGRVARHAGVRRRAGRHSSNVVAPPAIA
jgi:hypothetical protein